MDHVLTVTVSLLHRPIWQVRFRSSVMRVIRFFAMEPRDVLHYESCGDQVGNTTNESCLSCYFPVLI